MRISLLLGQSATSRRDVSIPESSGGHLNGARTRAVGVPGVSRDVHGEALQDDGHAGGVRAEGVTRSGRGQQSEPPGRPRMQLAREGMALLGKGKASPAAEVQARERRLRRQPEYGMLSGIRLQLRKRPCQSLPFPMASQPEAKVKLQPLDTSKADVQTWLVKVPGYVYDAWVTQPRGTVLGSLTVNPDGVDNKVTSFMFAEKSHTSPTCP